MLIFSVEYDGFRNFVSRLNRLFKMISRRTLKNDCLKYFEEQKLELQDMSKICPETVLVMFLCRNCTSNVSLTMAMWTSNQTIGYICITWHFIDSDWKVKKRFLRFSHLKTLPMDVVIFNTILETI